MLCVVSLSQSHLLALCTAQCCWKATVSSE